MGRLELVPADPLAVAEAWEGVVCALEAIGAAIEPAREGLAYWERRPAALSSVHDALDARLF